MLIPKLRVSRSRVKSGSFSSMTTSTSMCEVFMFKVKFIRAKSELNELFLNASSQCMFAGKAW